MSTERKGYVISIANGSEFYIPDALHIARDDELFLFDDDEQAARAAERDGVRLIYGMEYVPDGVYLDTPENREVIWKNLEAYPEYKKVVDAPQNGDMIRGFEL